MSHGYPRIEVYPDYLFNDYLELHAISDQLEEYLYRIDLKFDNSYRTFEFDQLKDIYNEIEIFGDKALCSIISLSCEDIKVPRVINDRDDEDYTFRKILDVINQMRFRYAREEENRSFLSKLLSLIFEPNREKKLNEIIRKHSCEPVILFKTTARTFEKYRELFIEILCREIREEELKNNVLFDIDHRDCICSNMFYNNDIDRSIIKSEFNDPEAPYLLLRICAKYIYKYKIQVREIIHRNPKVTNYTLDIINLICPVIAQKYAGIPALAIVGAITLLFKQGINRYLE
jgi:hypothetical protein